MPVMPPPSKRMLFMGIAFVILGILFTNTAMGYIKTTKGSTASYIMLGASIMIIISGCFRIWRSQQKS